ncbi:hypothetical protein LCGC14_1840460, partial [marine sediment metagenome]
RERNVFVNLIPFNVPGVTQDKGESMKYYFTFGSGQKHMNGYHIIEADSNPAARTIMHERFGNKWRTVYESAEAAGVEEYHLHEVFWPLPEMFTVTIYQDGEEADELTAELRTINAARIYITDCVKAIVELTSEQMHILAHVTNPKGELVWWIECGDTESAGTTLPLDAALALSRMRLKLFTLTEEEIEHVEFIIDAFIKRREE